MINNNNTTRLLQIAIGVVATFIVGYVLYSRFLGGNMASNQQDNGTNMPNFEFENIAGGTVSYKKYDNDQPTIVNFFHPDCIHCQEMGRAIMLRKPLLENTNLLLVSTASINKIKNYAKTYHLDNQENITFAHDTAGGFFNYFGDAYVPMMLAYNPDHTRKAILKGDDITPNDLMDIISEPLKNDHKK